MTKKVLVTDANQRSALSVVRSLGKEKITVHTADNLNAAIAGCSTFSKQHHIYTDPQQDAAQFLADMEHLIEVTGAEIIFPMTELTSMLLLAHEGIRERCILPFPPIDALDRLSDKCQLIDLASSLGIPVPASKIIQNSAQISHELDELSYPLVLKPGKSWQPFGTQWGRATVRIAHSREEAKAYLAQNACFQRHPFLIQECIEGPGKGVFALYDQGKPVAFFAHQRLREKPPSGGVSVLSKSVAVDPVMLTHARSLLDAANWHGIAMVEFKVAADGTPYLMEVNTRFWGSLQLAVDAGVNFPYLLYQIACGETPDPVSQYRIGQKLRWLLGDLDNLYLTLRAPDYSTRAKFSAISKFLTPNFGQCRHEVNRFDDFKPFLCEFRQYIADIMN